MKYNIILYKLKFILKIKWIRFTFWFTKKEYPRSILNKNVFFYDLLKIIGFILVFLIAHSNVDKLNQIVLFFFKIGSLLQIILFAFILRKAWHLAINLKYAYRGLNHGTKATIAIVIILLLFVAFQNQDEVVNSIVDSYENTEFENLNPINMNLNVSAINLNGLTESLNTCPQINVPMEDNGRGLNIAGKSYDGWVIKGDATCRKGTKEGENLNRYYCGGYTSYFGIVNINAYVEKTIVSKEGEIGKTNKYVIWNIYDENKNFVETKCLGNPDDFDEKQAEAFYNEMLKWN